MHKEQCKRCGVFTSKYWSIPYDKTNKHRGSMNMEQFRVWFAKNYFFVCVPCHEQYYRKKN